MIFRHINWIYRYFDITANRGGFCRSVLNDTSDLLYVAEYVHSTSECSMTLLIVEAMDEVSCVILIGVFVSANGTIRNRRRKNTNAMVCVKSIRGNTHTHTHTQLC